MIVSGHQAASDMLVEAGAYTDIADALEEIEQDILRQKEREEQEGGGGNQGENEPRNIRATSMTSELK